MIILNRSEFIEHWEEVAPEVSPSAQSSPLWVPEENLLKNQSQWFINCTLSESHGPLNSEYHLWCSTRLVGRCRCYSEDKDRKSWWGFTEYDDILIWMLTWA